MNDARRSTSYLAISATIWAGALTLWSASRGGLRLKVVHLQPQLKDCQEKRSIAPFKFVAGGTFVCAWCLDFVASRPLAISLHLCKKFWMAGIEVRSTYFCETAHLANRNLACRGFRLLQSNHGSHSFRDAKRAFFASHVSPFRPFCLKVARSVTT